MNSMTKIGNLIRNLKKNFTTKLILLSNTSTQYDCNVRYIQVLTIQQEIKIVQFVGIIELKYS